MKLLAYVDDNQANLDCLSFILRDEFALMTFQGPVAFLNSYNDQSFDGIFLDLHMPHMDGFSLYEMVLEHANYNGCPIFFFSSDDSEVAKIRSLELGAVDFIHRSTAPAELMARVKSKIQFYEGHRSLIEFDGLRVNLTLFKVFLKEREIPLTFIELKILCMALRNYPSFISKEDLVREVWKTGYVLDATLYTHFTNLNSKLRDWDYEVISVKSKGVQLTKKVRE